MRDNPESRIQVASPDCGGHVLLERLATQRRFRMRLNPPSPLPDDPFGDELQNRGQHGTRHTYLNDVWALMLGYAYR